MNADDLLRHYQRVADAADAVDRLRQFVLDLAVRGKLVPQDAGDAPASKLLASIAGENSVLPATNPLGVEEIPFPLPSGWSWSRVGEVCSKTGSGSTPRGGQAAYKQVGIPFLRSQNIYNDGLRLDDVAFIDAETHARMGSTQVRPKDLLLNITGGSIGRCCRVPDKFGEANVSQHVAILRLAIPAMSDYVHRLVLSPYFQAFVHGEQTGAGRGGLPKARMDQIAVAIPPLAEQQRIVAKVDELMALCDQLEAARAEREAARDRLAAATLARLKTPDQETFDDDAQFALNVLPAISSRPDQMRSLRDTFCRMALLGRFSADRSWPAAPSHLRDFVQLQSGYAFKSEWFGSTGVRLLRNTNVAHGRVNWADEAFLPHDLSKEYERFMLNVGDLVLSLNRPFIATGTKVAQIRSSDLPALLVQRVARLKIAEGLAPEYLLLWLQCSLFQEQVQPVSTNVAPHIAPEDIGRARIYVPDIEEQRRIVDTVQGLINVCDQMQASLQVAAQHRSRLLAALLREASDTGDRGEASDTGDRGEASDTGDRGEASDTGDRGEEPASSEEPIAA